VTIRHGGGSAGTNWGASNTLGHDLPDGCGMTNLDPT